MEENDDAQIGGSASEPGPEGLNTQTRHNSEAGSQTSSRLPREDAGPEPDMPLSNDGRTNSAQLQADLENYVPWTGFNGIFRAIWLIVTFIGLIMLLTAVILITLNINWASVEIYLPIVFGISILVVVGIGAYDEPRKYSALLLLFSLFLIWLGLSFRLSIYDRARVEFPSILLNGSIQQPFQGCGDRVSPQQSSLFTPEMYKTQSSNIFYDLRLSYSYSAFDMEFFSTVQANQTLCAQGFEGNGDLYGLGIRSGVYLQWIACFIANNFLPERRWEFQKVYLVFSLGICIVILVFSLPVSSCIFSIEIEVLYWIFWGGVLCVYAFSPNSSRLGRHAKWSKLNFSFAILLTIIIVMFCHGVWFIWFAYYQVFTRMPCGTYHFLIMPVIDPSQGFWLFRDFFSSLLVIMALPLLITLIFTGVLLASEIKQSVRDSIIFQILSNTWQMFFPNPEDTERDHQSAAVYTNPPTQDSTGLRIRRSLESLLHGVSNSYRSFREYMRLPPHARGGIRLVTPLDIRDRRSYRIRCALLGLTSCALSIIGIELNLKWNKVVGIYDLNSAGQYFALILGLGPLISVCWQLIQQEGRRRQDLRRRRRVQISQDVDGIELEPRRRHTLREAMQHAFQQPDIEFLTNDGALPTVSLTIPQDADGPAGSTPRSGVNATEYSV